MRRSVVRRFSSLADDQKSLNESVNVAPAVVARTQLSTSIRKAQMGLGTDLCDFSLKTKTHEELPQNQTLKVLHELQC